MKGYGLTVFKGIKIEKFDAEVISVLKNTGPRSGMILVKLKNETLDKTGVIAGMSGSPIYINNKLIGALAYAWSFSKEPFAGVTPIQDMMDMYNFSSTNHSFNFEPSDKVYARSDAGTQSMQIIKTPLMFRNTPQNMIDLFKTDLEKMNFLPLAGSGNDSDYEIPDEFKPGSAVGVNFITGDMQIGAIGTVTSVDKEKLLIFGHPMFGSGSSDLPLGHAYIHTVLPSLNISMKMGSTTKITGRVYRDQEPGLAGTLNETARMLPVKVDLDFFSHKDIYNYNIIRSYHFLPTFLTLAVFNSIEKIGGWYEKNTLSFNFNIRFNNNQTLQMKDTVSSLSTREALQNSMIYLLTPLSSLLANKFENVQINAIDVRIKLDNKIKIAEIENISVSKKAFQPGETLELKVKLKPYQDKPFYKNISIKLPANLAQEKFTLFVSSDQERQLLDYMLSPSKYRALSMEHLIKIYSSLARSTDLSVWSFVRDKSIIARDTVMENLPSSYYSILQDSLETGIEKSIMQIKNKVPTDYVIAGSAILTIDIKKGLYYRTPAPGN